VCWKNIWNTERVYAEQYRAFNSGRDLYVNFVLNPRVEDELLRPYRKGILAFFTEDQKEEFRANPVEIWNYIQKHVNAYPDNERDTVMETPYECLVSGIGTNRSQKVLFVAIARALGIPARLNPGNHVMEYWEKDHFVPVLKQQEGGVRLSLKKKKAHSGTTSRTGPSDAWLEMSMFL